MVVDYVTGLTPEEEKWIDESVKPIMSANNITTIYEPNYMAFAKTIFKKSRAESQIELNKWVARGLSKSVLLAVAKDVCSKDLV